MSKRHTFYTTSEKRNNSDPVLREQGIHVRGKRRPTYLPHSWDRPFPRYQKNWKKFRKTKYRMKIQRSSDIN